MKYKYVIVGANGSVVGVEQEGIRTQALLEMEAWLTELDRRYGNANRELVKGLKERLSPFQAHSLPALLEAGWVPVRETWGGSQWLVLLSKDEEQAKPEAVGAQH